MAEPALPVFILKRFVEGLRGELGPDTLKAVFEKAGLPEDWIDPAYITGLDDQKSAETYSQLQGAMRTYYGRGARGILFRIGSALWERILSDAPFAVRAQSRLMRGLATGSRLKPALEMLAKIMSAHPGDMMIHTLDLDLLFVDRMSATTLGYREETPICYVTQGLIRECLFWASGREYDIEETSCRATGAKECEFKIITGAKP